MKESYYCGEGTNKGGKRFRKEEGNVAERVRALGLPQSGGKTCACNEFGPATPTKLASGHSLME